MVWSRTGKSVAAAIWAASYREELMADFRMFYSVPYDEVLKNTHEFYALAYGLTLRPESLIAMRQTNAEFPASRERILQADLYDMLHNVRDLLFGYTQRKRPPKFKKYPQPWLNTEEKKVTQKGVYSSNAMPMSKAKKIFAKLFQREEEAPVVEAIDVPETNEEPTMEG